MKTLKVILIGIAIIAGSSIIILGARLAIINYALENLKEGANKALEENMKISKERMEKINQESKERARKDEELRQQREISKQQEIIRAEKWEKENSKECQFWRLQSKNRPTEKTERKIKEYCA